MMLPFAALADVVDYDEQLTGQRREAIYFGVQAIFQKTMIGLSILAFGVLAFIGGDGKATVLGLKIIVGVAGVSCLIGFFVMLRYPLKA